MLVLVFISQQGLRTTTARVQLQQLSVNRRMQARQASASAGGRWTDDARRRWPCSRLLMVTVPCVSVECQVNSSLVRFRSASEARRVRISAWPHTGADSTRGAETSISSDINRFIFPTQTAVALQTSKLAVISVVVSAMRQLRGSRLRPEGPCSSQHSRSSACCQNICRGINAFSVRSHRPRDGLSCMAT